MPYIAKKTQRKPSYVAGVISKHLRPAAKPEPEPPDDSDENPKAYEPYGLCKKHRCPRCRQNIVTRQCVLCDVRMSKGEAGKPEMDYLPQGIRVALHAGGLDHRR